MKYLPLPTFNYGWDTLAADVFAGSAWPQISTCLRRCCRRVEMDRLVGLDGG